MSRKCILILTVSIFLLLGATYLGGLLIMYAIAIVLLLLQTVYILKNKDSYLKFMQFCNPKSAEVYLERGEDFVNKTKKVDIVARIALILLFLLNAVRSYFGTCSQELVCKHQILDYIWLFIPFTLFFLGIMLIGQKYINKIVKEGVGWEKLLAWQILLGVGVGVAISVGVLIIVLAFFLLRNL